MTAEQIASDLAALREMHPFRYDTHPPVPGDDLTLIEDIWDVKHWPDRLAENHRDYLRERAVAPAVAAARGYLSGNGYADLVYRSGGREWPHLEAHMYSLGEQATWMLIPLYHWGATWAEDGERWEEVDPTSYQVRLDTPRPEIKDGVQQVDKNGSPKVLKFENPKDTVRGSAFRDMPADVSPSAQATYGIHGRWHFVICEGPVKGDAIFSASLSDPSTDAWLIPVVITGTPMAYESYYDHHRRKQIRLAASFDLIRESLVDEDGEKLFTRATVAFDSDWRTNPSVYRDAIRTGRLLRDAGMHVDILDVPALPWMDKGGIDDWLAYVHHRSEHAYTSAMAHLLLANTTWIDDAIEVYEAAQPKPKSRPKPPAGRTAADISAQLRAATAARTQKIG